jgi:translation elongation factor P/translation initiation factor 5A
MTTYTKKTVLTYQDTVDTITSEFLNAVMIKANQMQVSGKTDGTYEFLDEFRSERIWLDQDAADEWVQFVAGQAELYNVVITDYLIGDNV